MLLLLVLRPGAGALVRVRLLKLVGVRDGLLFRRPPNQSGEIITQCAIKMAQSFDNDKLLRSTAEISKQLDAQLSKEIAQKELLDLVPLPTSAKGSDIHSDLVSVVEKYCRFSECSCIVTDGAKCMTGKNIGLVGLLRKNDVDVPVLHSIIHQEVLCRKFVKMNDVIKDVTKINSNSFLRNFMIFLCTLKFAVKLLTAFFAIRKEIIEFLETAGKIEYDYLEKLQNEEWLSTLAFLTDITEHLNILNLKLQGKKKNICQLISHIEAFWKKLRIFEEDRKSYLN
ncbi:hypothetical protein PR048_025241 [Dryococelus australis]|uniref:Uncharacterized protein n=1 Tax=Dryococelus australis TaxID=614101 RepID=A0ABQ9GQT5_9NEOP|nr:hypothetical protein PR048_025241 [Dryococelus australis]